MTKGFHITDNRKVADLSDTQQSLVYIYLLRKRLNATEFEHLWQGYVVDLPDDIKRRIGIDLRAKRHILQMWA